MSEDGGTKPTSSGHDDTVPASSAPEARSSVPTIPPPPDTRYQLGQELGRGGMGRVVEAYDTHLQRTVALKEVLPKMANIDRRFQREVRITARLEHASIVPLYDSGRLADGRPYYVMRKVTGKPLDEVIARARTHEARLALLPHMLAAIDAMAHAHKRGVIHRDLKPQNILVGELGETVVIDWGLAKVVGDGDEPVHDSLEPRLPTAADSLQTQIGSVFGTPGFMAPEQARGDDLGPPGDVYALGATLYQMIVGKPPFGGTSATDVISSTLRHRLEPVARAAPGTPPELVTIIEKALAFEPENRYPDAGALAEDVRRFLTGQLVASHQYTPRQRVTRFARRHRAALTVAALALVGIAVLGVISVRSIVRERDAARLASAEAVRQRSNADDRAREIRERADQLLLLHARSLLEINPTQAMAALKQVESEAPLVRTEAIALARAAAMRGVAWGVPAPTEMTASLEMSSDGTRVLHLTVGGDLQVVDLDTRRKVFSYKAGRTSRAFWVDNGRRILVTPRDTSMILVDPATGREDTLSTGAASTTVVSDDGSRVAFFDSDGRLMLLEPATKVVTAVGDIVSRTSTIEIAVDGSWIACDRRVDSKSSRFVVVDIHGKILFEHDSPPSLLSSSPSGKLAVKLWDDLMEIENVTTKPVVTKIPIDKDQQQVMQLPFYVGETLHLLSYRAAHRWNGKELVKLRDLPDGIFMARDVAHGTLMFANGDAQLMLSREGVEHTLQLTSRPASGPVRVASTSRSSRLVATGYDALLIFDVEAIMPKRMPMFSDAAFVNETILIQPAGMLPTWSWVDVTTGKVTETRLAIAPGFPRSFEIGPDRRTLSLVEHAQNNRSTAVTATPERTQDDVVVDGVLGGLAMLVEGGIVFVLADRPDTLLIKRGSAEPSSLLTLDSAVRTIRRTTPTTYAALSDKGELVRGRIDGTGLERTRIEAAPDGVFISSEMDGSVLVALGERLVRWTKTVDEVARFASDIKWILPTATGTLVGLAANEMYFVAVSGDRTPHRLPDGLKPSIAVDGSRVIAMNPRSELELLELPSFVMWTLPKMYRPLGFIAISPSGRRVYQNIGHVGVLWTIPEPGADFRGWLEEQTNAVEVDRNVRWSWQVP